jgi:hypothetical protein
MKPNQADREAAYNLGVLEGWDKGALQRMLKGDLDDDEAIIAFMRVRESAFRAGMELARAEAARVVDAHRGIGVAPNHYLTAEVAAIVKKAILAIDLDARGEKE